MYARITTFEGAADRIDQLTDFVATQVRPVVDGIPDCLGLELLIDRERGRAISVTAYTTEHGREAAAATLLPYRERAAQLVGGTGTSENMEVVLVDSRRRELSGHCMRLTRIRAPLDTIDESIDDVGEFVLPAARTVAGFGGLVLCVDRETGTAVVGTSWDDRAAMEASHAHADRIRAASLRRAGEELVDVEEFDVTFSTLRPPTAHEGIMRAVFAAFSAGGNLDDLDGLIAADIRDHNLPPGLPPGLAGVKALMHGYRTAFPDLQIRIEQYIEQGDLAAVVARATATHTGPLQGTPPTGRRVDMQVMDLVRFEGNRAVEHWGLTDELGMMSQLGLLGAVAQTAAAPGTAG